jgi:hypothetical protein
MCSLLLDLMVAMCFALLLYILSIIQQESTTYRAAVPGYVSSGALAIINHSKMFNISQLDGASG